MKKAGIDIIALVIFSCAFCAFQFCDSPTSSPEDRGKLIYTKGIRASGIPITAQFSAAKFDAKIFPCANCHGDRGEGNPEGGVDPSPLEWSILTKPYAVVFKNGRKRTGYEQATLKRAIVEGIDPSENELDLVMPRYSLEEADVQDLIAYLRIIGKQDFVGVSDSTIHIGVLLSSNDYLNGRSESITKTIRAYLDLVNSGGGIYNRKFVLTELFLDANAEKSDSMLNAFLVDGDIFALVASEIESLSLTSKKLIEQTKIPVIGAMSGDPEEDYFRNNVYYLFPGLDHEIQELVQFAKEHFSASSKDFIVLYDSSSSRKKAKLEHLLSNEDFRIEEIHSLESDQLKYLQKLKNDGIKHCLYLGDAEKSLSFLQNTLRLNWYPTILLPGKFASATWLDTPIEMDNKIYFSYPTWISERNEKAMEQYKQMATSYDLDNKNMNAQLNGLAATILFTEVVKLSGKDISRASMIETLHGLHQFETGFVAPLSFGPNKRIGSEKVFVVKADLRNKSLILMN